MLDVAPRPAADLVPDALPCLRDAAPFEALRDRAEAMNERPKVFLAALGKPAAFGPRATWASNFFAAGGLAAAVPAETREVAALGDALAESGGRVACICGTDKAYAEDAAALATALRDKGARWVLLAGKPGDAVADACIDAFLHQGCDALAVLSETSDATDQPA